MAERKLIDECVHCGFCLPACPTYHNWGEEMDSPRGRIYLMKGLTDGKLPLNENVVAHFDACLGCMACVTACPSGVKYDALIEEQRAEVEAGYRRGLGDRLFRALIFALFPHPTRLRIAAFFQFLYAKTGLRWLVRALRLPSLLPPRIAQLEKLMPDVSARILAARLPEVVLAIGERRARVGLLSGCVQRVYFPASSPRKVARSSCRRRKAAAARFRFTPAATARRASWRARSWRASRTISMPSSSTPQVADRTSRRCPAGSVATRARKRSRPRCAT